MAAPKRSGSRPKPASAKKKVRATPPPEPQSSTPEPPRGSIDYPEPGPPPPYDKKYAEKVQAAAAVGFTITELARLLSVHIDVINLWVMVFPDFAAAMRANTQARTDRAEAAFYQRVVGYEQPTEKIVKASDDSIIRVQTVTHIPADPVAALNWLKTHRPEVYGKIATELDPDVDNRNKIVVYGGLSPEDKEPEK